MQLMARQFKSEGLLSGVKPQSLECIRIVNESKLNILDLHLTVLNLT